LILLLFFRYCGIFQLGHPILLIRDPELIKKITVKEFDSFSDHATFFDEEIDPFWGKNLFASRDYLNEQNTEVTEWDLNDIVKKFTIDVIATTAFGIQSNTLKEKDNEFFHMGQELTNFKGINRFKMMVYNLNPYIIKILNLKMISDNVSSFFHHIIKRTMEIRAKENIIRPDLIHLLMEARKGQLKFEDSSDKDDSFATAKETYLGSTNKQFALSLTDEDITAQSLVFFFGGYDTTSILINFCIYELVANPDIQERLRKEVDINLKKYDGKISYEGLFKMKYLDMVISETVRKWPAAIFLDRKVVKPFTIEPETAGEKPIHLQPGDICWLPNFAIQRDSNYWPNPDTFDPERFSDENRSKIHPFTFTPFGAGPRNCIGSRYAIMVSKLLLFYLLANFEIKPTKDTCIPLVVRKNDILLNSEHGFNFDFKKRHTLVKN
ncbi:hypothetical protein NQ314_005256, partial [Rhamnusium bicolor]